MRITFYSDAPFTGGHERMSARLANEIVTKGMAAVSFITSNEDLIDLLDSSIEVQRSEVKTNLPFPFLRNFSRKDVNAVRSQILNARADVVIVCQGDIEFGSKGLLAAKKAGALTVSYIPMAFTFNEMGAKLASLRDRLAQKWYRLPDAFITISSYQGQLLRRFSNRPIWAVPNPMEEINISKNAADESIQGPDIIRKEGVAVGLIGRVAFRQKNHPAIVRVMKVLKEVEPKAICHVVGDGADLPRLKAIVRKENLDESFRFHGWLTRDDVLRLVSTEVDIVVIPSRFEGVPLVLLEAIASGKPFLVSPFPWLEEYGVPSAMQANWSDEIAVVGKIQALKGSSVHEDIRRIHKNFMSKHSLGSFEYAVREAVTALTELCNIGTGNSFETQNRSTFQNS